MEQRRSILSRLAMPLVCGVIGMVCVTGCSHPDATQSPQDIKAALSGNYSPAVIAQGRAAQQQEMAKQAAMIQNGGKGSPQPSSAAGKP